MNNAAMWSAIAALFSAISSFLIMMIHRRNLHESVRPELVLTEWARNGNVITYKTIRNIGRGVAFHLSIRGNNREATSNGAVFNKEIAILGPNESKSIDGKIVIWWDKIESKDPSYKHSPIDLSIACFDSRGVNHKTSYSLIAFEPPNSVGTGSVDTIAPGLVLSHRATSARSAWRLRLEHEFYLSYRNRYQGFNQ